MLLFLLSTSAFAGDILLIGASYMERNELGTTFETLLDAGSGRDRTITDLSRSATTWTGHVGLVATEPEWQSNIVEGTWEAVFLHEFADVADQPQDSETFLESLDSGKQLATWLGHDGAALYVWETWGDRDGGPDFADYDGMQTALTDNVNRYVVEFTALGAPSYVVPIGTAFRLAFAADADPMASKALFTRLYSSDDQHPSPFGSYLIACVMFGTLTGIPPAGLPSGDSMDAADAAVLQELAWSAVQESVASGQVYPWLPDEPDDDTGTEDTGVQDTGSGTTDTGAGDTGTGDSGLDDTGLADTSDYQEVCPADTDCSEPTSCGCATGGVPGGVPAATGAGMAVVGALLARRKR